jgi:hypothetical protein
VYANTIALLAACNLHACCRRRRHRCCFSTQHRTWCRFIPSAVPQTNGLHCTPPLQKKRCADAPARSISSRAERSKPQHAGPRALLAAACWPGVPRLLVTQACCGLGQALFQSALLPVLKQHFDLTSSGSGAVLSYVGGCVVIGARHYLVHAQ